MGVWEGADQGGLAVTVVVEDKEGRRRGVWVVWDRSGSLKGMKPIRAGL